MSGDHAQGTLITASTKPGEMMLIMKECVDIVVAKAINPHDAHRLAACWNAFEGMLTEHVKQIGAGGGVLAATMMAAQAVADRDAARAEVTNARTALATAEQILAERDARIAALERRIDFDAKIMNDLLVGNQSAWIEWQHGKGAEEAMAWIEGCLMGCGTPDEDEPWSKDAQAWYSANKADPFPACFCGRPSNHLWMGRGFCCDDHYNKARVMAVTATAGFTSLLFDGTSPDTEGGGCD